MALILEPPKNDGDMSGEFCELILTNGERIGSVSHEATHKQLTSSTSNPRAIRLTHSKAINSNENMTSSSPSYLNYTVPVSSIDINADFTWLENDWYPRVAHIS